MRRILQATVVTVCLTCLPVLLPAQSKAGIGVKENVQKTIAALEFKWAEAQKIGDAKAVTPLLSEDFVNTDTDGNVSGKSTLLSNLKGGKWEHNEIRDVKVIVHGTTAIATGTWEGKGADGDGTRIDRREHWTDTWVRAANGKWLCVASQQTEIKSK